MSWGLTTVPLISHLASISHKAAEPEWHQIFLRGIGCNWLVCVAVWVRPLSANSHPLGVLTLLFSLSKQPARAKPSLRFVLLCQRRRAQGATLMRLPSDCGYLGPYNGTRKLFYCVCQCSSDVALATTPNGRFSWLVDTTTVRSLL